MNIDKFLKFFVPKDHSFFPLFESDAQNLVKAADLLRTLMASTTVEDHERI
jgi:Mg2+/Co2+ transporter CorC